MAGDEWPVAFDGGSPRTRKGILRQLNDRLKREPGIEYTRFEPGTIAPTELRAAVQPSQLLEMEYPAPDATLSIRWSPRPSGNDHFAIQYFERPEQEQTASSADGRDPTLPEGYTLSCGWQQDDHCNELGEAHFQEEYPTGRTERYGVSFGDQHPVWILSTCLAALPDRLTSFRNRLNTQ
ncbi:hypothetical protein PNQ29_03310 [Halobacterium salinarum]|uniref:hypothetical protein n=1 Tax=Halobacterium salinarum TaxID=2242 RepID=UPI00255522D5|nr:hypothetical protein [Halobacterium salinarum]MDL0118503.1 hypothetical protein [Halobacterium salinarum]MDL0118716.1 hypothetical protein [Halobacterium salinarum]MDL0118772.1 hypothetical protein [Halobacterium salinarum]